MRTAFKIDGVFTTDPVNAPVRTELPTEMKKRLKKLA